MTATGTGGTGRQRFPWALTLAMLAALGVLLALGTWQVERLAWKEALIARIHSRLAQPPQPLAEVVADAASGGDIEYRPVSVSGLFLHDRENFFFATHDGQSGWFVYTPLALDDGRFVFVNRGFVPYDRKPASTRGDGQIAGPVGISGLARSAPADKPSRLVPDNEPGANVYYWKDLAAMTAHAGLDPATVLPLFVDADARPNPGGLPVGGVTIVDLPNSHLQYAVTWYGLALALVGVYVTMLLRRGRPDGTGRP